MQGKAGMAGEVMTQIMAHKIGSVFEFSSPHQGRTSQLAPAERAELYLNASSNGDVPVFPVFKKKTSASLIYYDKKTEARFSVMNELF